MPYEVVTTWYPTHIRMEVAQKYLEVLQAIPNDDSLFTSAVPVTVKTTKDGVQAMSISEVKPGKLEATLEMTHNRMAMFADIEGFEWSVEVQSTAAESLARAGLGTPD